MRTNANRIYKKSMSRNEHAWLLSFSGVDGAGKSTQIATLQTRLLQAGLQVRVITFWDQVVVLKPLRESLSYAVFKGEKGVGTPERPVQRRDKNVSSGYAIMSRLFLYLLDAIHLTIVARWAKRSDVDVVIFDRYIYDELANLPFRNRLANSYVRWLLSWSPEPDIAYFLDAEPEQACSRKPEYPIQFVRDNRSSYLALSQWVNSANLIPPLPVHEAGELVAGAAWRMLWGEPLPPPAEQNLGPQAVA